MPDRTSSPLIVTARSLLPLFVIVALSSGCVSENEIRNCITPIEVGITQPDDGREYLAGDAIDIEANIRSLCGSSFLEEALYVVTSDVDGELGGQLQVVDGVLNFHSEQIIAVGPHSLTLRADSENSARGEGTVGIIILENLPPTVEIISPNPTDNEFEVSAGATVVAQVSDPAEPLDSLLLRWTLDGVEIDTAPTQSDADGNVTWLLAGADAGCRELQVTVTDNLDQQSSDSTEFILWSELADLSPYQWWMDQDEDGYGTPSGSVSSCLAPVGIWLNPTLEDCADDNADVYPGHADYCDDGIDSDCSALTPSGCFPTGNIAAELSDASLTGSYDIVAGVGDVTGDGWNDIALGGRDASLDLIEGPVLGSLSADFSFTTENFGGAPVGSLGLAIAGRHDFNDDGIDDMLLGNPEWGFHIVCSNPTGITQLQFGGSGLSSGALGAYESTTLGTAGAGDLVTLRGPGSDIDCTYERHFGTAITWLPDADGDDIPDFAISGTEDANGQAGAVYLYLSTDASSVNSGPIADSNYRLKLTGPQSNSRLGLSLASADVDGDGLSDLLIGSLPDDSANGGIVYVLFGRDIPIPQASLPITSIAGLTFTGAHPGAKAGTALAGMGDLDGDGDEEFLVSAPGERAGDGIIYLVPGFYEANAIYSLEDTFSELTSPTARGAVLLVGASGDALQVGKSAGDINGDGHSDLLIGAPSHNSAASNAGAAYLLYGGPEHLGLWWDPSTGMPHAEILLDQAVSTAQSAARFFSSTINENLGYSVDPLGDINGDGFDDLIIGANPTGGTVRVFFGGGT